MSSPLILRYELSHAEACLRLFDSNVGRFFALHERQDFEHFLRSESLTDDFFVILANDQLRGCGGFLKMDSGEVELVWGMIDRACHGDGLGTALLQYRLERIDSQWPGSRVRIDTSQHTQGFFERFGFMVLGSKPDGFGPGIDQVTMKRILG